MVRHPYVQARAELVLSLVAMVFHGWQQHVTEAELLEGEFGSHHADDATRQEIIAYRRWLSVLSDERLTALANANHVKTRNALTALAHASCLPFTDADPDAGYFATLPFWRIDESVALLQNLDPESHAWVDVQPLVGLDSLATRFARLRELLQRAVKVGELDEEAAPAEVVSWAQGLGLEVPKTLEAAVSSRRPAKRNSLSDNLTTKERQSYSKIVHRAREIMEKHIPAARADFSRWFIKQMVGELSENTVRKILRDVHDEAAE